jgi:hypothetical protein
MKRLAFLRPGAARCGLDRHLASPFSKVAILLNLAWASTCAAVPWQSTINKDPPGNFPELRPVQATYRFGWAGFTAATADVDLKKAADSRFQFDGTGRTTGFVRALWKMDVNYRAITDAETLRPIESKQTEAYRAKKLITQLNFTNHGVTRARTEGPGAGTTTSREFTFPNLFDLYSAMLYLRSQSLEDGSVNRVVVYPASSAYVATITVLGREKIAVHAGTYSAIKFDLQLKRIGKTLELEPHRKFRRGTIWVSDDADRMLLRVEAQIFVGTIFAELQSVSFENPKS